MMLLLPSSVKIQYIRIILFLCLFYLYGIINAYYVLCLPYLQKRKSLILDRGPAVHSGSTDISLETWRRTDG